MGEKFNITIDGPAGAGKSTVAKIVADQLNYVYLDTGAMYRVITYLAINKGVDFEDAQTLAEIAQKVKISFEWGLNQQRVYCFGQEITDEIRTPLVSNKVSIVAKHPLVREQLLTMQRQIAKSRGVVLDGRDTGTCVLPNADYKFFLTASVEQRAQRRAKELLAKGYPVDIAQVMVEISQRDKEDMEREVSPLKKAPDAILIDTSSKTIDEVVSDILEIVQRGK